MNAPTPALVAQRPERLRLVGQKRQMLAIMHQRLMFGMLVYAGIIALIAALFGFGGIAGTAAGIGEFIFFAAIILLLVSLVTGGFRTRV